MPTRAAVIAIVTAAWLSGCGEQPGSAPPEGPRMVFAEREHQFGTVLDTRKYEHAFSFTNEGTATLVIEGVSTSCDCIVAEASPVEVGPGETGEVTVAYEPRGEGGRSYVIDVVSNDARGPILKLYARAFIEPLVQVEPPVLGFGSVEGGRAHAASLTLFARDPRLEVVDAKPTTPVLTARTAEDGGEAPRADWPGRAVLAVTLSADAPLGFLDRHVAVTVRAKARRSDAEPTEHTIHVPVQASVHGRLRPHPGRVPVTPPAGGGAFSATLTLTSLSGEPFSINAAEVSGSTLPGVRVRVEPATGRAATYTLTLDGDSTSFRGAIEGEVTITTDVEGEERVVVPFRGRGGG